MTGHYCNCGFYARTLSTFRAHSKKCNDAAAKLRAAEDRERVERVERAKAINEAAREDAWRDLLEKP